MVETENRQESGENNSQNQNGGYGIAKIVRIVLLFFVINKLISTFLLNRNGGGNSTKQAGSPVNSSDEGDGGSRTTRLSNLWPLDQRFDARIYFSHPSTELFTYVVELKDCIYGDGKNENTCLPVTVKYPFEEALNLNTKSLKVKIRMIRAGMSFNQKSENYDRYEFSNEFEMLKIIEDKENTKNLLLKKSKDRKEGESVQKGGKSPYVDTKLSFKIVKDKKTYQLGRIPQQIGKHIKQNSRKSYSYNPITFHDTFMTLNEDLKKLNETGNKLDFHVAIETSSMLSFMFKSSMETSIQMQSAAVGSDVNTEFENIKRMFRDNNPYFLGLTAVVSIAHTIFDILAFKNDIQFWRGKNDTRGLSVRTIFIDVFCSIVIFLYLLENETSRMILISSFASIFVELWKLKRAFKVKIDVRKSISQWIQFPETDGQADLSETDEYDKRAVKFLCWILLPLVLLYSVYSLFYEEHKSWYQWILNTLVGSVYTFGFITMCPQLYINYKLQSVAHLPWRMMTYKALNTVIDDLFAFVIKMPLLHRISVFRDDLVFAVFLYQKWRYRVDYTRANEFGFTPAQGTGKKTEKDQGETQKSKEKKPEKEFESKKER